MSAEVIIRDHLYMLLLYTFRDHTAWVYIQLHMYMYIEVTLSIHVHAYRGHTEYTCTCVYDNWIDIRFEHATWFVCEISCLYNYSAMQFYVIYMYNVYKHVFVHDVVIVNMNNSYIVTNTNMFYFKLIYLIWMQNIRKIDKQFLLGRRSSKEFLD